MKFLFDVIKYENAAIYIEGAEVKYEIIYKSFYLVWLIHSKKTNKRDKKSRMSWLALLFKHFFKKEKKRQRIYDLLHAETKPKFLCLAYTKQRKLPYTEKIVF